MAMLSDKLRHILDTRAEVCTAADNSCLMHIGGALRRQRAGVRVDAPRRDPGGARERRGFPAAARAALGTPSCGATSARRRRRSAPSARGSVAELPDWEALRDAGAAIKARAMATLPEQLERLEAAVTRARRQVHWARDAAEANAIVAAIARAHGAREVIKVKSIATDEIELNDALAAQGITAIETDLAELINQLAHDTSVAHPRAGDPPQPGRDQDAVRAHDRRRAGPRLGADGDRRGRARTCARSSCGAGGRSAAPTSASPRPARSCVVESEGNGRMCTTLPRCSSP